ncbi:MAG: protein translocase subunit secB [Betaproteobacteria bacterium]|jgi:preprotein translocase subunit SecB|nr:protein translocase subunit secB [Betaproteobacteria bacterium]MEA3157090.1 preprotein translocase subunit SecB [Betaproteobacteria bacterium]
MSEQQQPVQQPQAQQPLFGIEKIYLKDMSLELPNAPQVFFEGEAPQIEVNIHNEAAGMSQEGLFEVVLTITVTAKIQDRTVFLVEAAQAGIFQIRNVPQPDLEAVLGTLCPNTLLPYAREAVASVVQRAGFPPVTLQHMNFDLVYQQRMQQMREQQSAATAPQHTH